ncbi:MAG: TolC family protein [Proteobacteria bacterium]|nr:TolC family protein [Pseudomonadota bacterium]MBU1139118.1 TolC family protein [Pseudomonadota bacterium]
MSNSNVSTALLLLFLLLIPLLGLSHAEEPAPLSMDVPIGTLTLREAQRMALASSPSIEEALARIQASQAVLDQARSSLQPTANFYAGYRNQDSSLQPDWAPEVQVRDNLNISNVGIQANWLIFDGFSRRALILASQHGVKASEQILGETRRLLAEAVATAYYQAQLAVESMLIAQQNHIFNRALEKEADIRWQVGSIPEADKLNFSVRALQAGTDFIKEEQIFEIVTTVLAELMALPEAKLPEEMYPVRNEDGGTTRSIPSYEEEFSYALQNRPDLKALQSNIAALQENKKAKKGDYSPKVFLNGGFDYTKMTDIGAIDQEEHDAFAGLSLSWDLYKGGERLAKIREVDQIIRATRQQQQQMTLAIQSAIRQSIATVKATRIMSDRRKLSLALTARIRDHVEKAYRAGAATLTRLNEAQTDLVRASGAEAASRINYLLALQQLDAASSRILDGID